MSQGFRLRIVAGTDMIDGRVGPTSEDVRREAQRRLSLAGYGTMYARQLATGGRVPNSIAFLRMQIEFVAETLAELEPIPEDFRSDEYWPNQA
ncbi:hypothetical protein [Sinorhizobium sp. BG8]|uniref:hypothetical protein n=1 Tax=Sinorhizobium sp. BG8 TaxID=2613773 RepID=UPI00193EC1A1|nr:hypothetical protein [Sinorhizobium sp. BG8]QRM57395.1 hypothetical protein F3Y30_23140 [Sinorhizobium sp. BG8]